MYDGIEDFVDTIHWWQNNQSQSRILDPPNEDNVQKLRQLRSVNRALVSLTPCYIGNWGTGQKLEGGEG